MKYDVTVCQLSPVMVKTKTVTTVTPPLPNAHQYRIKRGQVARCIISDGRKGTTKHKVPDENFSTYDIDQSIYVYQSPRKKFFLGIT